MKIFQRKYESGLLLIMCVVSRLPQLFSQHRVMDGDECIVGLMAKHLYDGIEFPLYFYGQSYGFTAVETLVIALFYFFLGITALSVKLAMLSQWTSGVYFFYKTVKQITEPSSFTPLFISIVFILAPAWAIWSMMARGGYLTAFMLSNVCIFLLLRKQDAHKQLRFFIPGVLCVLIYESHALWFPALLPIVFYALWKQRNIKAVLVFALALVSTAGVFYGIKIRLGSFWPRPVTYFTGDVPGVLRELPLRMYHNMTGSYYYKNIIDLGPINNALALFFVIALFIALLVALYLWIRRRGTALLYMSALAVVFILLTTLYIPDYAPRYLLPLSGAAMFLFSLLMERISFRWLYGALYLSFILPGAWAFYNFKNYRCEIHNEKNLVSLSNALLREKIHYVFCKSPLLQWQIDFYSKEKVIARYSSLTDRYPSYINEVNKAFQTGKQTAIVDFYYAEPFDQAKKVLVENIYLVEKVKSKEQLNKNGFNISK